MSLIKLLIKGKDWRDKMELDCSLLSFEEDEEEVCESEKPVITEKGYFLGLDISEMSTGVCIYSNGIRKTYNFSVNSAENSCFGEVLLRRCLKENLRKLISGSSFDVVIVEDVFQGINPLTTRKLYALNTAIDEMILDGEVSCEKFFRVSNQTWKSWLFKLDTDGCLKGMNDKLKIETCLGMLGITEKGSGFQDRLDATGMIVGYLLNPEEAEKSINQKKKKRVSVSDIVVAYSSEQYDIFEEMSNYEVGRYKEVREKRWTKTKILDYLTDNPEIAYITEDYVLLGNLANEFDLPFVSDGGILGFWIKPNKLSKYL